jgi:hypothetical protein
VVLALASSACLVRSSPATLITSSSAVASAVSSAFSAVTSDFSLGSLAEAISLSVAAITVWVFAKVCLASTASAVASVIPKRITETRTPSTAAASRSG